MTSQKSSKALNISLWVLQGILAALFIMSGSNKSFLSIEALTPMLPWVTEMPVGLVRLIGLSELAGGIGILVPAILRFKPSLVSWAAYGLGLVQILAAIFHATRGEYSMIAINLLFAAFAFFVAWGRSRKSPIQPRQVARA